jgi:hypothetical protein
MACPRAVQLRGGARGGVQILMIILGWAGKDATPALAPLAYGPIASFVLAVCGCPSPYQPSACSSDTSQPLYLPPTLSMLKRHFPHPYLPPTFSMLKRHFPHSYLPPTLSMLERHFRPPPLSSTKPQHALATFPNPLSSANRKPDFGINLALLKKPRQFLAPHVEPLFPLHCE